MHRLQQYILAYQLAGTQYLAITKHRLMGFSLPTLEAMTSSRAAQGTPLCSQAALTSDAKMQVKSLYQNIGARVDTAG